MIKREVAWQRRGDAMLPAQILVVFSFLGSAVICFADFFGSE